MTKTMRILHLTLKKKWFDMIASGEKKEEYREMKDYWYSRFLKPSVLPRLEEYDFVIFKNGYSKNAPTVTVRFVEMFVGLEGNPEWGAEPGKEYFVIKLGEIIK
jgi:hypothetical protein